eukprot:161766-Prymnesium_polylepis.3
MRHTSRYGRHTHPHHVSSHTDCSMAGSWSMSDRENVVLSIQEPMHSWNKPHCVERPGGKVLPCICGDPRWHHRGDAEKQAERRKAWAAMGCAS